MDLYLRNVKIKPSKICSGVGLFSIDKILADHIIFNYNSNDYPDRIAIDKYPKKQQEYLFEIWGNKTMPVAPYFHPVNFLNHSYNPTVKYDNITCNYLAIKDLKPDDELTINYTNYNDPLLNIFKHTIKEKSKRKSKSKRKNKSKSKRKSKKTK